MIRTDIKVPEQDPPDPAGLSEQTKRFLDSQGKSSHAVSLTQAIAALNKRVTPSDDYRVDAAYAPKHVTLAGMEKISPPEAMQSLATVYGLLVAQRSDGKLLLTAPLMFLPDADVRALRAGYTVDFGAEIHVLDRMIFSVLPAPIYRAIRARVAPGHPIQLANVPADAPKDPAPALSLDQFEAAGTKMQNTAVRLFRYLAEPQVQAQPGKQLTLSRLGERARNLFAFARTVPAFADACGLVDCPQPPYVTDFADFCAHVTLFGDIQGDLNAGERLLLTLRYDNPDTGINYGPVLFFDAPVPPGSQTRVYSNGHFPPRLSPDPY